MVMSKHSFNLLASSGSEHVIFGKLAPLTLLGSTIKAFLIITHVFVGQTRNCYLKNKNWIQTLYMGQQNWIRNKKVIEIL